MKSESAANSDIVEPGQEFSKYVSPPPPDLRDLNWPVSKESEAIIQQIIREIGACRLVPQDSRIELSFYLDVERFKRRGLGFKIEGSRERLKQFSMIKNEHFQFEILDSNLTNPAKPILACYKPDTESVILFETTSTQDRWKREKQNTAPKWLVDQWRRIIWCQGLSSVLDPKKDCGDRILCSFPYLISDRKARFVDGPIEMTIQLHLKCSKRLGSKSANPYYDQNNGFHIVFYEKIGYWKIPKGESWKTGELYLKTAKGEAEAEAFRRSAFTILARSESRKDPQEEESELCWTLLLLTPSDFFLSHDNFDNPLKLSSGPDIRDIAIQRCMLTAELTSILYAMKLVVKRWEELYQHIEGLLHEDFMNPATYVELLFDDENFSQSRLYFWVIGCVNEFQISIEDNIKQWTLFREARVESYLERNQGHVSRDNDSCSTSSKMRMGKKRKVPGPDEEINTELPFRNADVPKESESSASFDNLRENSQKIKNLAKKIDVEVESLINWQSQFKHQQETAQAYRDGLFNASALMESRASTRLGENVKLLTYVSIFYLPLAFCAALWAIPDITSSGTRSPFILTTILVGFVTYLIVFNLGNIVKQSRRVYEPLRAGVIKQICKQSSDDKESWRRPDESEWDKRAQRFESTFGPKRGDGEPSEWWIPIYSMTIISKWFLVHFRSLFRWISQFFWKIFVAFGNAFQWMRQLLKFPRNSTSNNSQEDSTINNTGETV
ncbi:uncharacterized protein EAF02_006986 [Botrytis sinoallii]|uniref:uncharacterized protein n=1 Tax=Botrytis sinoallii TaxID=1463999 RepID=UPI0019028B22|nr:uncharacterized protein EAF02_006986 [Botrytis sinoallii]KAF7881095.1 hypothetical protein EAF02_006986 [Botrytis sinoallii]